MTYISPYETVFIESGLTMPEFLIMAIISLINGGGLTTEHLISYTQRYIRQLNIPACGEKNKIQWAATDEELFQAINELERKRYLFVCKKSDIDLLQSFFSWNGIEYVAHFPIHEGRYYMTYTGFTIGKNINIQWQIQHNRPAYPHEYWDFMWLSNDKDYLLSGSREGIQAGLEACDSYTNGEVFPIGPWTSGIWEVFFHGYATRLKEKVNEDGK